MSTPHKQTLNPATAPQIAITIHSPVIIHPSIAKSLIFQILMTSYTLVLISVTTPTTSQNLRIKVYCSLFALQSFLKTTISLIDTADPLGVGPVKTWLRGISWVLIADMVYLLGGIWWMGGRTGVGMMSVHFGLGIYRERERGRGELYGGMGKHRLFGKVMDFINPIMLYTFIKQLDHQQSDFSIIFLIFLCCNLVFTSQIRLILNYQQNDFLGWSYSYSYLEPGEAQQSQKGRNESVSSGSGVGSSSSGIGKKNNDKEIQQEQSQDRNQGELSDARGQKKKNKYKFRNKEQAIWDRNYALKLLVISCCVLLVLENFLLFFQSIKNQICLNILHTLIIAGTSYFISSQSTSKI